MENFSQEITEKWKFKLHDFDFMINLIGSQTDFFVYGVKGCGKTEFVSDILSELSVAHVRINCI
jgi:hypothetical protein